MSIAFSEISLFPVRRDKQIPIGFSFSGNTSSYYNGVSSKTVSTEGGISKTLMGQFDDGSAAAPSITFKRDTDTGFWRQGANSIGVSVGGDEKFRFDSTGSFYADDDIVGFSTYVSDIRLKAEVEPIQNALGTILKLNGIKYKYLPDSSRHYGLIAQHVEYIIPEIIKEHKINSNSDINYKTIRYTEIIPFLVNAIKDLNIEICKLKQELNYLRNYNS